MVRISQNDPRWANTIIGNSSKTISQVGCLIVSLCMLHSKWYPKNWIRPNEAAKTWKFTSLPSDPEPKYLDWVNTDFEGMRFIWREWDYDKKKLEKYVKDGYGCVVRVKTKSGGQHWLAVWWWGIFEQPICFDPINGHILYKPTGWLSPYAKFDGFAVIQKK
jgi:hypothetical protein